MFLNCSGTGNQSLKWTWYPSKDPQSPVIVGEASKTGIKLENETIEVERWFVNKTASEFNIRVKNVTWAHRGDYKCSAAGETIEYIKLDITVEPWMIACFKTHKKLDPQYWYVSRDVQVVLCNITCTHPKPETTITGAHMRIREDSKDCTGNDLGMKKYGYLYVVKNSSHTFTATGFGYNKSVRFFYVNHIFPDNDRHLEVLYFILFITFVIISIIAGSIVIYMHLKHIKEKKWEKGIVKIVKGKKGYDTLENEHYSEMQNNENPLPGPSTLTVGNEWDASVL